MTVISVATDDLVELAWQAGMFEGEGSIRITAALPGSRDREEP